MTTLLEPEKDQAAEPTPAANKAARLAGLADHGRKAARAVFGFLPELGLLLFMLAVPMILMAYPAWRIADRLVDYSAAHTAEAKLSGINVRLTEIGKDQVSLFEARKHYDIQLAFQGDGELRYESRSEMSWPSPGLKAKLENLYQMGDPYTLYLLPDQSVVMEEDMAKDSFYRLTGLMGLVFIASALTFRMWKRLKHRMPSNMPTFPVATEHSIMLGQLITLIVVSLWAVIMSVSPLVIQIWLFLAVYWGAVALISLSLHLLLFAAPDAAASPLVDEEKRYA